VKKKSIILEGPNGGGKSTLSKMLAKDLGLPTYHSGPNPGDTNAAIKACQQQFERIMGGYIIDRVTPISRPIYDHDVIPKYEIETFELYLDSMMKYAVIIHCDGRGLFTAKDYYPEGHFNSINKNKEEIQRLYFEMFKTIHHIHYNWKDDSYDKLLEKIKCKIT